MMKYVLVIFAAILLCGCDGVSRTTADGSIQRADPSRPKYGSDTFTLLCISGVEYMRFGTSSATPKYNIDGTLVPCEYK